MKIVSLKKAVVIILFASGLMCSSAQTFALASSADDIALILKNLGKILIQSGKLAKENELIILIGKKIDDFGPYMKQLADEDRVKLYLEVAENKKLINASEKLKLHREIAQGKLKEDDLVSMIRDNKPLRKPSNSKYAGKNFSADDLAKISPQLAKKYPNGVNFTNDGYPDFVPYAKSKVSSNEFTGNRVNDAKIANKKAGYDRTPEGYVWHHHQDCMTLLLVPLDLHGAVRHYGGAEKLLKGGERC